MKYTILTALIVSFGISGVSVASPVCEKLKIPANKLAAFRPHDAHGKVVHNRLNDAVTCLDANWSNLSQRLTFRGSISDSLFVLPTAAPVPTVTARYSPAASYNANAATPVAFLTRPAINVNYLPMQRSSTDIMTHTYRLSAPNLADGVPTANYQGSLATPIVYQTGYWNK
jgi:hypothetical protein